MSDRRSMILGIVMLAIGFAIILVSASACSGTVEVRSSDPTTSATTTVSGRTVVTADVKSIEVFGKPYATRSERRLTNPNADGAPLVFLTTGQQAGWYHVLLPVPPNQSTGWVRASDVVPYVVDYRLEVRTKTHRLLVYRGTSQLVNAKIGVGTGDTPTPGGEYYLTELLKTPDPTGPYGPYAYGISGQSTTLKSFNGQPPVIGLHGTNQPELLGKNVSHGCIRVDNATITKLAKLLPLGTPVNITTN